MATLQAALYSISFFFCVLHMVHPLIIKYDIVVCMIAMRFAIACWRNMIWVKNNFDSCFTRSYVNMIFLNSDILADNQLSGRGNEIILLFHV